MDAITLRLPGVTPRDSPDRTTLRRPRIYCVYWHWRAMAGGRDASTYDAPRGATQMSQPSPVKIPDLIKRKARDQKITMLTAYDATMARLLDQAGIDVLLVGDSLGMVILGYENTIPVTLDAMVHHTRAVSNGARRALVVADLPFLTYQVSVADALRNAGRLLQEAGAAAVKMEGGKPVAETLARLVEAGVPVMGHIGMTPQSVHRLGGFR